MKKNLVFVILLMFMQILLIPDLNAQFDSADLHKFLREQRKLADSATPAVPNFASITDTAVISYYNQSMIAYYTYKRDEFYQANRVFYWQLISSKIIFFVVIALVVTGIWFAGVQFYSGLKKGEKFEENKLEFTKEGVKLNSSVIGLIILVISIAFFYLYLVYVYPIHKI
jgi:hypothetical protein